MHCRCGRLVAALLFVAAPLAGGRWLGRTVRRRFGMPPRRPELTPDDATDVVLDGANGQTLRGWLFGSGRSRAPAVVVMHGWGASAGDMLPAARMLADGGFPTLVIDARCHGRSDSDDFASMPRFAEDVDTAVAWLRRQPYVDPERIASRTLGRRGGLPAGGQPRPEHRRSGQRLVDGAPRPVHARRTGPPGRTPRPGERRAALRRAGDRPPLRRVPTGPDDQGHPQPCAARARRRRRHRARVGRTPASGCLPDTTRSRLVVVPGAGHDDLEALQSIAGQVVAFHGAVMGSPRASSAPQPTAVS